MNTFDLFDEQEIPHNYQVNVSDKDIRDSFIIFMNHYPLLPTVPIDEMTQSSMEQIFLLKMRNHADVDKEKLERVLSLSQTFFEKEMLLGLIVNFIQKQMTVSIRTSLGWDWITPKFPTPYDIVVKIKPQYKFNKNVADIFIEMGGASVWIECDGRQAHSSAKKFRTDRIRDRELAKYYRVMHFANAEIISSTYKVISEITETLVSQGYNWSN